MIDFGRQNRQRRQAFGSVVVFWGLVLLWLAGGGCASAPRTEPDYRLISEAYTIIQQRYVSPEAVHPTDLTYGAIGGMVDALGDTGHSTFLTPAMERSLRRVQSGEFKGVGIELQMKNGSVVVVAPIDGSPAQRAGVKPGEIIQQVDGQDISDWTLSQVVERITGRKGTKVRLTLQEPRTLRTREITLVRASIRLRPVTWRQLPGTEAVHLRIASFDAGLTKDLRKALVEIQAGSAKGIVLDLRNNPGGLLDEAIGVASQFLAGGKVLLAKDGHGDITPVPVQPGGLATNLPLVVLINEGTASAAEIVAGALRDAHRAPLVGEKTFGTGTVLQEFRLSDGSALLLAIEEWLTPRGESFWHKGLAPQHVVTLAPDATPLLPVAESDLTPAQLRASDDRQLLRALELLGQARLQATTPAAVRQ